MKPFFYICIGLLLVSCTSNTIYKKPENLIPKDSMIALLTDMYIASSAKNQKNKFLEREKNYMILVYEKYKIDTTRFDISNTYYTSQVDEYTEILKKVKSNIDSLNDLYREKLKFKEDIEGTKEINNDSILNKKHLLKKPEELIERDYKELEKVN
ncbi:uncharacterized protein DUF4296 [Tenacibaculum lutimaris]|uniref:Uncharacterized protein DUF4296 n=1 Tax=Tenacibaculum lutimaris TaxID=285258 RepID=A0A420E5P1_9FLAO|nr:DUF4296 domain-containing protein [Tenacibaculum lutimaris]RKF05299.1 uncharacterized protein DUF4296 [Tenacibaculum lutimaris]